MNPLALLVQRVLDGVANGSLCGSLALAIAASAHLIDPDEIAFTLTILTAGLLDALSP